MTPAPLSPMGYQVGVYFNISLNDLGLISGENKELSLITCYQAFTHGFWIFCLK